jgi:acyl carrier protein
MTNIEKYRQAFMDSFEIGENALDNLTFQSIPQWDSVGHMSLIAALEDTFDIMFDTDDIVDLNSFQKGIETMKKYGIEI